MTPEDERHGTNAGYAAGCRDQCCRDAMSARRRANRKRAYLLRGSAMLSALGSQRRIHALQALGWRQIDIAEAGGWAATEDVDSIMNRKHVIITTAQRVDEVYSKLCMTLGPSNRTRLYAARQGWAPPLAWDNIDTDAAPAGMRKAYEPVVKVADDLIVRAVIDGSRHPKGISVADRRAIVRELRVRGQSSAEVALRCGVSIDVVEMDIRRTA